MSGWQTKQIGKFSGYEIVTTDDILNKECTILDYTTDKIVSEKGEIPIIHFLVHLIDENKDYEVKTTAQAIVRTILSMDKEDITKLIKSQEKTMFIKEKTSNGFSMLKMI